jgi:hypothetical protein
VRNTQTLIRAAVEAGQWQGNSIVDAVGPDIFTFEQLVRLIMERLHKRVILTYVANADKNYASELARHYK